MSDSAAPFGELDLGGPRLYWLDGGGFRSDGGAQFGPVPRTRWAAIYPPAEDNTVPLTCHVAVVHADGAWGLIDSGLGHHLSDRQRRFYMVERESTLERGLAELGLSASAIDWVVLTHLHLDHAGGLLWRDEGEDWAPVFPNAGVHVQMLEAREARDVENRAHAVYTGDAFDVLERLNLVREIDGQAQISASVGAFLTGGHTRGHQGVLVRGANREALLHLGDLVITRGHLSFGWVSANDDFPLDSIRAKREWLTRAAAEGWWVAFSHDVGHVAARLGPDGKVGEARTAPAGV